MPLRLLPILLAVLPMLTWAADDCTGKPPLDCAVSLVQQGRFPDAINLLEKFTAESPKNLNALNLLGIALGASGDLKNANARLRQALQIDPNYLPALKNLAINQYALGELDQSKTGLETVLKKSPNDEVAHLYLGEIAFAAKQFSDAASHYQKAGARAYPAIVRYAESLIATNRKNDAMSILRAIPAEDSDKQLQAGVLLGQSGDYTEAATYFARARAHARDPYPAAYNQVLMLLRGGDYPAAIQLANELFTAGLRRAELYNLAAEAYVKTNQTDKAREMLQTAIQIEPDSEESYVDLAGIYLDNAQFDEGIAVADAGLKRLPDSYRLHLNRGLLLAQKGPAQTSVPDFQTAARLAPSQPLPFISMAYAWMQTGDTLKAVEMLREQVKAKPDDPTLPYILGVALIRSGEDNNGEAKAALEASVRLNPQFSRSRAELGKLLLQDEDIKGAIEQLEVAVKLDPENGNATYQLGQAYRRNGERAKAQEMLDRVVKMRHQKDDLDPEEELKKLIRPTASKDRNK